VDHGGGDPAALGPHADVAAERVTVSHGDSQLTRTLVDFTVSTRFEDLPDEVVRECTRLLLDTIGCAVGGLRTASGQIALRHIARLGGEPAATVIGRQVKNSAANAAYANARLANVLDADDTFPTSAHFGNATTFGALALAEDLDRTGRDLITAIAVGFDVGARIGSWMGAPFQIKDGQVVGWNELGGPPASVTWAAIGASVSISGLSPEQAHHAFGIGGANCPQPTIRKWAGSEVQPMYKYADAGWCAAVGVNAAMLAGLGSTGFLDILDGEDGFWKLYGSPTHDDEVLLQGLGSDWQILNTTYKPWPCCRWIHHPLTAFTRLIEAHELRPAEIDRVIVRANPFALTPIFCEQQPADALTAEFSHPHALAVAAHHVPSGPQWYAPEVLSSAEIRSFRAKVFVEPEPRSANIAEWMGGGQWRGVPGGVDIEARGTRFTATADYALGDPWSDETLMSDTELIEKFRVMVTGAASGAGTPHRDGDALERAIALLLAIDAHDSVRSVMYDFGRLVPMSDDIAPV
jgi:2-methylcitrate dehydratase PrpD